MQYLFQIARSVRSLVFGSQPHPVLLQHGPSCQFLAGDEGWTTDPAAACRLSSEEAEIFLARYACEPEAWLVVAVPESVAGQAAA